MPRVLIIENPAGLSHSLLCELTTDTSLHVFAIPNLKEGMAKITEKAPDALVISGWFPKTDAAVLAKYLRIEPLRLSSICILFTAVPTQRHRDSLADLSVTWEQKPPSKLEIALVITKILHPLE